MSLIIKWALTNQETNIKKLNFQEDNVHEKLIQKINTNR